MWATVLVKGDIFRYEQVPDAHVAARPNWEDIDTTDNDEVVNALAYAFRDWNESCDPFNVTTLTAQSLSVSGVKYKFTLNSDCEPRNTSMASFHGHFVVHMNYIAARGFEVELCMHNDENWLAVIDSGVGCAAYETHEAFSTRMSRSAALNPPEPDLLHEIIDGMDTKMLVVLASAASACVILIFLLAVLMVRKPGSELTRAMEAKDREGPTSTKNLMHSSRQKKDFPESPGTQKQDSAKEAEEAEHDKE